MARLGSARVGALVVTSCVLLASLSSCATTARISDVYTALDGQGNRKRNVFSTDSKEIHCVVEMGIGRPGVTIEALVRQVQAYDFKTDTFIAVNRVIGNAEQSPGPSQGIQRLDIALVPLGPNGEQVSGQPFTPGRFICEASLDGALEMTATFNVDFPDCPMSLITPSTLCFGFYKNLSVCPRYGVSSTGGPNCQCDQTKGWQCDP
jgi:coenzyme F420-reducing hydrogenase gamma subunit